MEDFFDDFDDDFDNGDLMDEDFFEDNSDKDTEIEEPFDGDPVQEDEFTAKEAFFLGSAIGWGYEEGLTERKQRKRKKFSDDSK